MTSRNIFSSENQMQVIPLARNPREKNKRKKTRKTRKTIKKRKKQRKKQIRKKKKIHKKKRENMSPFCNLYPITATQFIFGKLFPEIML